MNDEYDDSDTLGGQLRRIEAEARAMGAYGLLATIDKVHARNREATFAAVRQMGIELGHDRP